MIDQTSEAARIALLDHITHRCEGALNPTAIEILARAYALVVTATPGEKESGAIFLD